MRIRRSCGMHSGPVARAGVTRAATIAGSSRPCTPFAHHSVTCGALSAGFGPLNRAWKRFSRLSCASVFVAFFETLMGMSRTAHLVQVFGSTAVRAHVSATGARRQAHCRRLSTGARAIAR